MRRGSAYYVCHLPEDGLTDILGITVDQRDTDALVKQVLQIGQEGTVDEVSSLLECEVDLVICSTNKSMFSPAIRSRERACTDVV